MFSFLSFNLYSKLMWSYVVLKIGLKMKPASKQSD